MNTSNAKNVHPWIYGAILFWGAVFGMNAHFLTKAIQVHPELVTENYYEQGLIHDQSVAEKQAWVNSGLKVEMNTQSDPWTVTLNQKVDQISGGLYRASNQAADIQVDPIMQTQVIQFPQPKLKGQWELNLRVQHQGQWMTYHQRLYQ